VIFGHQSEDGQLKVKRANVGCLWRSKVTSNYGHVPATHVRRNQCVIPKPFQRQGCRGQFNLRTTDNTKRPVSIGDTQRAPKFWLQSRKKSRQQANNLQFRPRNVPSSWKRRIRSRERSRVLHAGGAFLRRQVVSDLSSSVAARSKIDIERVAAGEWPPLLHRRHRLAENVVAPHSTPPVRRLILGADVSDVATKVRTSIPLRSSSFRDDGC
jgi:hypothetical protein